MLASLMIGPSGLADASIALVVDDVGEVPSLGKIYAAALEAVKLRVEFVVLPQDEASQLYEKRGSGGQPTIWLSTR